MWIEHSATLSILFRRKHPFVLVIIYQVHEYEIVQYVYGLALVKSPSNGPKGSPVLDMN